MNLVAAPSRPFDWTEAAAFVALLVSLMVLSKQALDLFVGRKKEGVAIQDALEKRPLVREQLSLGNVDKAVEVLNAIIESQRAHISRQDERIQRLEEHNEALENESEGWAKRHAELEERCNQMERRLRACEGT